MDEIGSTLRETRMRSRIDINEVERRTKIRAKYLRAIENEEWDLLPGPIYAKSFLRTYGDFLGLDSRLLVDEFRRRYERPSEHDLRPLHTLSRDRERMRRGPLLPPWMIVALVLGAVVVVLYLLGSRKSTHTAPPVPAVATQPRAHRPGRHHAAHHTVRGSTATVALAPTGTVYVCMVDGSGRRLIDERTFNAGQPVAPVRGGKLLLTLGNNLVTLRVDGRAVAVPASAQAIRFLIEPGVVRQIPLSVRPTCP